jgi:hypothetical protein
VTVSGVVPGIAPVAVLLAAPAVEPAVAQVVAQVVEEVVSQALGTRKVSVAIEFSGFICHARGIVYRFLRNSLFRGVHPTICLRRVSTVSVEVQLRVCTIKLLETL